MGLRQGAGRVVLVAARELREAAGAPATYLAAALFMALCGTFFTLILHSTGTLNLAYLYRNVGLVLVLLVPAVTMGAFALERQHGTAALLLTAPLTAGQLVAGKFLAAAALVLGLTLTTLQYPLWVSFFAPVDGGRVLAGTLGCVLLGLVLTSLGLLASALAPGQALACVLAVSAGVGLWCAGSVAGFLAGVGQASVRSVSLYERLAPLSSGQVDSGDAAFFLLATLAVLVVLVHLVRRQRVGWGPSGPSARLLDAGTVVLVLVSLTLVQSLADRHARRRDLTEEGAFTLAEPTRAALSQVTGTVGVSVFIRDNDPRRTEVAGLLREFSRLCPTLDVRFVDPEQAPAEARRLGISSARPLAALSWGERVVMTRGVEETHFLAGLRRLVRTVEGRVLILQGHGEAEILGTDAEGGRMLAEALVTAGLSVDPLIMLNAAPQVPADAAAVLVLGPRSDLLPGEVAALDEHLARGGGLVLALERVPGPNWAGLLDRWGLIPSSSVVVDPVSCVRSPLDPVCQAFRPHPVTRSLASVVFHGLRPLRIEPRPGVRHTPLILTSSTSWGETNPDAAPAFDPSEDLPPPLTAAAAAERPVTSPAVDTERTARLLVVGDGHVLTNGALGELSNADLGLAAVEWAAGHAEGTVMLPKRFLVRRVYLTPRQFSALAVVAMAGVPFTAVLTALALWWRRR